MTSAPMRGVRTRRKCWLAGAAALFPALILLAKRAD
jgi:hypothetical protein